MQRKDQNGKKRGKSMDSLTLARFISDFLTKYGGSKVEILGSKNSKIFNHMVVCTAYDNYNAQILLVDLLDYVKAEFGLLNCGLEGYKKTCLLDKIKAEKCFNNGVKLVYYTDIKAHIDNVKTFDKNNIINAIKNG